ncbi:MAG: PilZ domain-containing protein [Bdellovibrionota bacterium]
MNEKIWFIMKGDQITGPFEKLQAEIELNAAPKCLIWGKGMTEWLTDTEWQDYKNQPQPQVVSENYQWKYKFSDETITGPMGYQEMIFSLKKVKDYEDLQIWSESFEDWKSIFLLPSVSDDLGISRRKHSRVPIMGLLEAELDDKGTQSFRVISISQGGVGLSAAKSLKLGANFKGVITSINLNNTIHCDCNVTYAREDGYIGIEFGSLPAESLNTIVEYVKKFEEAY